MKKKVLSLFLAATLFITTLSGTSVSAATDTTNSTFGTYISLADFQSNNGVQGASATDTISTKWSGTGDLHKVTVTTAGWILITGNAYGTSGSEAHSYYANIYTDSSKSSQIGISSTGAIYNFLDQTTAAYVEAGTYYYDVSRWNGAEIPMTVKTKVGFIPTTSRFSVASITYAADARSAVVSFKYNTDYAVSLADDGTLLFRKGLTYSSQIKDKNIWTIGTNTKRITSGKVTVTQNGNYSARLGSTTDILYTHCNVVINKIKTDKLITPTAAAALKSKVITGKGNPFTKTTVVVGTKKYTVSNDATGKYTVKLSAPLVKGNVVKIYQTDSAGATSSTYSKKI